MSSTPLTCLICAWRRPDNVRTMLSHLRRQTIAPKLWLWSNETTELDDVEVDWHVRSSRNVVGDGILALLRFLETPYFCYLDDDIVPRPGDTTLLSDAVGVVEKQPVDRLVGPHGVILQPGRSYRESCSLRTEEPEEDIRVDLLKFRTVFGHSGGVRSIPFPAPTRHFDLYTSFALAGTRRRWHLVSGIFHGRMLDLPEGSEALSKRPDHFETRDRLSRAWLASAEEAADG
jgi:hypothetical protein